MKCGLHSRKTVLEHRPVSEQEIYTQCFHGRLDRRRVYIMFVHVYATFIPVLPILRSNNQCHGLYVFFTCSHELKQCNRGYRLQIILGTDCFIHPRNLKGALYSRDAWTFSNQPWMILRVSRHSEHENLTQSRLQPQGISRQPFRAQDL